jgi:hypothetical protein
VAGMRVAKLLNRRIELRNGCHEGAVAFMDSIEIDKDSLTIFVPVVKNELA